MPSGYTGNPLSVISVWGAPVTIADPVDSDAPSASSVSTPLDTLADFVAFIQAYGVYQGSLAGAGSNALGPAWLPGNGTDDTTDHLTFPVTMTAAGFHELASIPVAGGSYRARLLVRYDGSLLITMNAAWQGGTFAGGTWKSDDAAVVSSLFLWNTPGVLQFMTAPATGSAFGNTAWNKIVTVDPNGMAAGALLGCTSTGAAGFDGAGGVVQGTIREALTLLSLSGTNWGAATAQGGITWDAPGVFLDAFGVAHLQGGLLNSTGVYSTVLATPLAARFRPANTKLKDLTVWNPNAAPGVDGFQGGPSSVGTLMISPSGTMDIIVRLNSGSPLNPSPINGGVYLLDNVSWRV
jgi:hypothetical protein